MRYYATGVKKQKGKDGEAWVNVMIPLSEDSNTRAKAVNQAMRIAKRDRLTNVEVRVVYNTRREGEILTKNAKARKLALRDQKGQKKTSSRKFVK
jgi:hypothetical protein